MSIEPDIKEEQMRDARGRYMSKKTQPEEGIKTEVEFKTPLKAVLKKPDSIDEPLVSFKINNPFKKVLHWLDNVRRHQTTSFDFKIKVPLLALPIFLAIMGGAFQAFFTLGKIVEKKEVAALPTPTPIVITQPTIPPQPVIISRLGTIKATYQVLNLLSPTTAPIITISEALLSSTPSPTISSITPTPIPASRYVLVDKNDQIIFLLAKQTLSLNRYLNERVLITGLYDTIKNTLEVSKSSDIEIMP